MRHVLFKLLCLCIALSGFVTALVANAQSPSLSVPSSVTLHPGDTNVPISVTLGQTDYAGPIYVVAKDLPSGVTSAPLTLRSGGSGILSLNASTTADTEDFRATDPSTVSHQRTIQIVAIAGTTQVSSPVELTVSLSNPSFVPSKIDLPVVRIDTGGVPVVTKTDDIPGTITITSADAQTTFLPASSSGDNTATFHVHGNTTAEMPKLPYEMKLHTSIDLLTQMGMQCPYVNSSGNPICDKSKTYILLANFTDKTFLRDWAASALANAIPLGNGYLNSPSGSPTPSGTKTVNMPWAPHSLFVELYLNGVYEGNYQLIEKVNVDSHRINISELDETDTTKVTGGYLMEIDHHESEAYVFVTPQGVPIGLQDPDFSPDPEVPEQTSYISSYVNTAENALFSANFQDPATGWRAYFDEASAVNYYIVNDLMGNVDGGAFYSSDYLYKDKNNPLLYMGPIWDFDVSAGNVNYQPVIDPSYPWMQQQAVWYKQWFQDPGFKADVATQWNALKNNGVFTNWLSSIQQQAAALDQSQNNNFGRWPMRDIKVWPNPQAAGSYSGELSYFLNWVQFRMGYLDSVFNQKTATSATVSAGNGTLRQGQPATLFAHVSGGTSLTGSVAFLANSHVLGTAALDGTGSATFTTSSLQPGSISLEAVYSGDDHYGLSVSPLTNASVLQPLIATSTLLNITASSVYASAQPVFNVTVAGNNSTVTPTGSITFQANGQSIGTAALNAAGMATFSAPVMTSGSYTIQAVYSGDGNNSASSSSSATLTVLPIPFTLAASPADITVKAGSTATFTLTVTQQGSVPSSVSFACSGLPAGKNCSFSPATVTPGASPATTTLTISSASQAQSNTASYPPVSGLIVAALGACLWPLSRRRKCLAVCAVFAVLAGIAVVGCGGGSSHTSAPPPPTSSTYSATVTASAAGASQTTTVTVTETN